MSDAEPEHPQQPSYPYFEVSGLFSRLLLLEKEIAQNDKLVIKLFQSGPAGILGERGIRYPCLMVNVSPIAGEALNYCTRWDF